MLHKWKLTVLILSAFIVLYGVSAAFYGKVVAKDEAYKELSVFIDALRKINDDYVESPDLQKVQDGAMRGLIEALDPYSAFLTKEQLAALEKRKAAGMAGIGVALSKRADLIYVVSTERNGPAEEAGLRPGDYVIAVDGVNVEDKSIVETESLLRGPEGSKARVSVFRSTRTKPAELEITRKADAPMPVGARMVERNIGLLEISSLGGATVEQARVKLKTLISAGAQSLILDLRGCADGGLAEGAELANFFVPEGVIYYSKNRVGEKVEEVRSNPARFITDHPLAVLINGSTGGAAEVVAGALKDHKRATLIGEKTFGIGSSQKRISLKSGAVIVLSTAKIYTPNGKMIQDDTMRNTGIKPDIQAPDEDRHQDLLVETYYDDLDDSGKYKKLRDTISKEQIEKAVEFLMKSQASVKKAA